MDFFQDKENVTSADAYIRALLGVVVLFVAGGYGSLIGLGIGAFILFTAVTRSCIFYHYNGLKN